MKKMWAILNILTSTPNTSAKSQLPEYPQIQQNNHNHQECQRKKLRCKFVFEIFFASGHNGKENGARCGIALLYDYGLSASYANSILLKPRLV